MQGEIQKRGHETIYKPNTKFVGRAVEKSPILISQCGKIEHYQKIFYIFGALIIYCRLYTDYINYDQVDYNHSL